METLANVVIFPEMHTRTMRSNYVHSVVGDDHQVTLDPRWASEITRGCSRTCRRGRTCKARL